MNDKFHEKTLSHMKWVPILGTWSDKNSKGLTFTGGEFLPQPGNTELQLTKEKIKDVQIPEKHTTLGQIIFDQRFIDGSISLSVEFEQIDHRSQAHIMIQCDPTSGEMLLFGIGGGGTPFKKGTGAFYGLRFFGDAHVAGTRKQGDIEQPNKGWNYLYVGGEGKNLKPKRWYNLEVNVQGSLIVMKVDGVEVGRYNLPISSLPGRQVGVFCGNYKNVNFKDIKVAPQKPKAFVVMQFDMPEYEALYKDVIEPICNEFGMKAQRADSTYLPGLVIADIKQQITESRVVIAEITPANANVYYEVGYADALNKPLILIADKKEGLKPFDVRAYRTIFYENSIAGKNKVEEDLRNYLKAILSQ